MRSYIHYGLRATPSIFEKLIMLLPEQSLDVPTHPDRFTPREVVAHMADWEPIMRDERLKRAVDDPGCTIVAYDEVLRAIEQGYTNSDVAQQLSRFAAERSRTVTWLETLTDEELARTFIHPETGQFTVAEFVANMLGHDVYHIEQLTAVLEGR